MTATLLPTSDESSTGTIYFSSGTTAWNLLDDDDGLTNYIQFSSDGYVSMNYSDLAANAVTINSVTVFSYYRSVGAYDTQKGRLFVKIGGTKYYGGYNNLVVSAFNGTITNTWTQNPATSSSWTVVEVNALIAGVEISSWSANDVQLSYVAATIDYLQLPPSVDVVRHLASVDLNLKSQPEVFGTITGNLDLLNVPILGVLEVEHTAGPHATGLGWEDEVWQRRPMAIHGLSIDQNACTVTAETKDQRSIRRLVRDLAWSDKSSGLIGDGIARFATPGATFTFTRPATETFTNPVSESETAPIGVPGYADGGLEILASSSSRYYVTNNIGYRTLNASSGSFQCEVKFLGALAEDRVIAYCYHDASNYLKIYYDNASGKIKFSIRAQGTTTTVTALAAAANATWYQVGIYWAGFDLENGHTVPTIALYIDRVLQETAGSAAGTAELLVNGGFESCSGHGGSFVEGWTNASTGSLVSATPADGRTLTPRTGAYQAYLAGTLGCNGTAIAQQDFSFAGGSSITVSAYTYSPGGKNGAVFLQNLATGNYYNGSANAWQASAVEVGSAAVAAWTLITETLTVEGSGSQPMRITLECVLSSNGAVYFDDVSVVGDVGGVTMAEASSSNFDFGSAAGSDLLRGQIRKIHSYQHVLTPTEMQRTI